MVLAVRDPERGRAAERRIRERVPRAHTEVARLQLADLASVREFGHQYDHGVVDILVNNAGLVPGERTVTTDGFELAMGVNHLGHFLLTTLLTPALLRSDHARVVHLGSLVIRTAGSLDPQLGDGPTYTPFRAYAQSKLACAMFGVELDRRAKAVGRHLTSVVAHPGWSGTGLFGNEGMRQRITSGATRLLASSPEKGAQSQIRAACDLALIGGEFIGPRFGAYGRPSVVAHQPSVVDRDAAQILWDLSEKRVGQQFELAG